MAYKYTFLLLFLTIQLINNTLVNIIWQNFFNSNEFEFIHTLAREEYILGYLAKYFTSLYK